jgi:hypothetical protein
MRMIMQNYVLAKKRLDEGFDDLRCIMQETTTTTTTPAGPIKAVTGSLRNG